jgi:hypothetical protein
MTKAAATTTKHGGPGRGQGRKPVKQGEETVTLSMRVTVAQREKLARLGGAEWVRGKIDKGEKCGEIDKEEVMAFVLRN